MSTEYRSDLFQWRFEIVGASYDDIADRCGISKDTAWRIINGKTNPHASSINRISKALGLEPKFALDFKLRKRQFRRAVVATAR
jgi:transcriptional regulator with XRE-family HTH domain